MSETIKYIQGSKGGAGGGSSSPPPAPTRTPDNLRSKDTLEIILGISEGPIYGLEDGAKSFFIGDTKLQNENDEYNFKTFQLNVEPGDESPNSITPILGGTADNFSVNLSLASGVPVVRQRTSGDVDALEVRLNFQRLLTNNDDGTFNADITFRIEYKAVSAGSWTKFYGQDIKISGKTTSTYIKEFRQPVARIEEPYEIRVTKVSGDNTETYFADLTWESYQSIIQQNPKYPYTAVTHLVGEASDQFSSIPAFKGVYKGMLIKVPVNYNPETRTYSGVWDGTFKVAWTDNPAWILYDFVMNDRYGIKSYYSEINLDKYDVYEAAQWCDELVPDGAGGTQPRYTFNALISEPRSGKEMARYIAGSFNATFFDDLNGKAYLRVDKEETADHIFTAENIYEEGFEYSYVDISTRFNDITVTYRNPDLNWAVDRRRVFNQEFIDKNGRIPHDFVAVGCINTHEAIRRAQHKLLTANTEVCIVKFRTNRIGQFVNPFDTILIADPDMGYGVTGRIKSVEPSGDVVNLRDPVFLESGVDYGITFTLANGDQFYTELTDPHPSGSVTQLQLQAVLPSDNLPEKTTFALENTVNVGLPRPFRVVSVIEEDGNPDSYTIEAININRNKWYDADNVTDSGTIQYSALPNPFDPPGPTSVDFVERYVKNKKEFHITVSPIFDRGAYKYYSNDHGFEVWSRPSGTNEVFVKREVVFGDTLINHPPGTYDFKVLGKSYLGIATRLEASPIYVFNVTNPADPPKDVDWAKINEKEVYWGYENAPDDFAGFLVRYHNQAGRTTWQDAARPHEGILTQTSFYTNLIPPSARVIMVRAVDDFGVVSENSAIIYRDSGEVRFRNILEQYDYHTDFIGTKDGCSIVDDELVADDTGGLMYSDNPVTPIYDGGNMYESVYNSMNYYPTVTITGSGSLKTVIDADNNGYQVDIREAGDITWSQIPNDLDVEPGDYELRVKLFGGPIRGIIREFSVVVDVEDEEETLNDLTISAATYTIPITKTYSTIKTISVIIQNEGPSTTAVTYRVVDKDNEEPKIELLDTSGAVTSGLVDIIIRGY